MDYSEATLDLPTDFSLGNITVYTEGNSEPSAVVDAKGQVRVPATANLFLDLSQEVCDHLEKLPLVPNRLLTNGVRLVQRKLHDARFERLRAIQGLSTLVISMCGVIRTEQLRELGTLDSLEHLDLSGTEIDSSSFTWLSQFPRLKWLSFSGSSTGKECLEPLSKLPLLEHLDLGRARLTDDDVQLLWFFPKLKTLILGGCDVGDSAWSGMASCKKLSYLHLPNTRITDSGVDTIVTQAERGGLQLRTLVLRCCQITDRSIARLSSVADLRSLDLWGTAVTANGIAFIRGARPRCTVFAESWKHSSAT
jgi:Leucine-rich repeat (LRR) protein